MITVNDIATEIYEELDSPTDKSVVSIEFWLRSNVGKLNTLITTSYTLVNNEFSPEIGLEEKDIFKQMFLVNYYSRKVSSNLGAAGTSSTLLEVTEGNRTVRKVNRNEVAKTFQNLKQTEQGYLDMLIAAYKINHGTPRLVSDSIEEPSGGFNPSLAGGASQYRDYYDLD